MCFSLFFHFFICFRREVSRPWHLRKSDAGWLPLAALVSHGVRQLRPTRSLRPSLRGSRRGCSGPVLWNEFSTETSPEKQKPGIRGTETLNISKSWLRHDLNSYIILYTHIYIIDIIMSIVIIYYLPDFFLLATLWILFLQFAFRERREFATISSVRCTRATWSRASPETSCWGVGKRHPGRKDVGSIWLWPTVCHEKSQFLIGKPGKPSIFYGPSIPWLC